jgi:S1-C subfamily serine protease
VPLTQIDVIMTRACTTPGDSGTALLDARGNFLGIATGRVAEYSFFSGADAVLRHPLVGPLV